MRFEVPVGSAHPRSRGEHSRIRSSDAFHAGSSPLARGTHSWTSALFGAPRLIPARAGNTGSVRFEVPVGSAHPRSRGEHTLHLLPHAQHSGSSPLARGTPLLALGRLGAWCGSSPLARGTHGEVERFACHFRLIPARAGNTVMWRYCRVVMPAHPRSRGEHTLHEIHDSASTGSSPLARGTRARLPRIRAA